MALNEIDIPSIPAPATNIQTKRGQYQEHSNTGRVALTQDKNNVEEFSSWPTKKLETYIIDTVNGWMVFFEHADHVVRPRGDYTDRDHHDKSRTHT